MESCRGDEAKVEAIERFDIWPIQHAVLLAGQEKTCCCGRAVKKPAAHYYRFQYVPRNTSETETPKEFIAAQSCARNFLDLTGEDKLPCINPLTHEPAQTGDSVTKDHSNNQTQKQMLSPFNKEIMTVLNLFLYWRDGPVRKPSDTILKAIVKQPSQDQNESMAKSVNTIVQKNGGGRTLTDMLNDLREKGNDVRDFSFPLINEILRQAEKENFIEP